MRSRVKFRCHLLTRILLHTQGQSSHAKQQVYAGGDNSSALYPLVVSVPCEDVAKRGNMLMFEFVDS